MRLDYISIFPDYFEPLSLSLLGRAQRDERLSVHTHQLREYAHDKHRCVDDSPTGGGAGMVMMPQPWSEALTDVLAQGPADARPVLIFPGPSGQPFTQAIAEELAGEQWLIFGCGRFEGIDERVYEWASEHTSMRIYSLGDYVLNGGEVAALAMTEAIARLIPGVIGNAASLDEESHTDGLLEYPLYTQPASWQDPQGEVREVPEILLSGNHAAIAQWRQEQREQRTSERRPDLRPQ